MEPTIPLTADAVRGLVAQLGALALDERPLEDADDVECVERLRQFEALRGALAAAQQADGLRLRALRARQAAVRELPARQQTRSAAAEIALARQCSPVSAARWLGNAHILRAELPATFAQLAAGRVGEIRALAVAKETVFLTREQRAEVDTIVAPRLAGWSDRQAESETRRLAQRLDPSGATARARVAITARHVSIRLLPDTMCRLSIVAPAAQGIAAYAALRRHSDTLIGTGEQGENADGSPRGRAQVMADTAVERLTGQASAGDTPVEIQLVMTDRALFRHDTADNGDSDADGGDADEPAILLGYGPVPAPLARDLALRATPNATRWIRRLYLTPDSAQLVAMDSTRRLFTPAQQHYLRTRDHATCRTPYCDAPMRHADHITGWSTTHDTRVADGRAACQACNQIKESPGWHLRADDTLGTGTIITTTPTGHRYLSHPPRPPGPRTRPRRRSPRIDLLWPQAHRRLRRLAS
ncbi:DUF222 domain-containing protein [Jatrophihabitans fulvus]